MFSIEFVALFLATHLFLVAVQLVLRFALGRIALMIGTIAIGALMLAPTIYFNSIPPTEENDTAYSRFSCCHGGMVPDVSAGLDNVGRYSGDVAQLGYQEGESLRRKPNERIGESLNSR